MKYLQDYQEEAQTALFKKTGAFFAFSNKQFDEEKKEGVKYVHLGAGLICPKVNAKELNEKLDAIYKDAIKKDIAENGIEAIIKRELYNHECFYTGDITDCVSKLQDYPTTKEEIWNVYKSEYKTAVEFI
jgi:hypothetical protein